MRRHSFSLPCGDSVPHTCACRAPIVDFAYTGDAEDLWLCLSTSDDGAKEDLGGGTLQLWRMTELVLEAAARGL